MEPTDLDWICGELELPVLEETASGLSANRAAQAALDRPGLSLAAAASQLLALDGDGAEEAALAAIIQAARFGERRTATLGPTSQGYSWRVLATPLRSAPTGVNGHSNGARVSSRVRLIFSRSLAASGRDGLVEVAAAVSHEVANAVGSIRGWADLALHHGDATVDMRDALTLIRGAARNAEQAARSMLMVARGQAQEGEPGAFDVSEFAGELLQLLTLSAREARVTLESSLDPSLFVPAARAQLFTILFNLVKNAIEACKPGGLVSVQLKGERERVCLSVRDTGEGLDRRAQERIFDRYYTTKAEGTGLGLSLVRSATAGCGAELEIESETGRGTTFRVLFPRAAARIESSLRPPRRPSESGVPLLPLRVLVVDDDHALREMLATALSLRGAEVTSVGASREALELTGPFDIALIDMMLDGCRGDELLGRLRQHGVVSAAILVTGTVQKPRLVPGGEPDDWVRKPFEISQLVDRVRRTIERHRMLHDASSTARL